MVGLGSDAASFDRLASIPPSAVLTSDDVHDRETGHASARRRGPAFGPCRVDRRSASWKLSCRPTCASGHRRPRCTFAASASCAASIRQLRFPIHGRVDTSRSTCSSRLRFPCRRMLRLRAVLDMIKVDPAGKEHKLERFVFGDLIGRQIKSPKKAWAACCKATGIEDLHFHDLRHEAASRLLERGLPLQHVQCMLGSRCQDDEHLPERLVPVLAGRDAAAVARQSSVLARPCTTVESGACASVQRRRRDEREPERELMVRAGVRTDSNCRPRA